MLFLKTVCYISLIFLGIATYLKTYVLRGNNLISEEIGVSLFPSRFKSRMGHAQTNRWTLHEITVGEPIAEPLVSLVDDSI